jgi:BirA family biotin operon repressor/biotin-[acetyl-CoA-carboxylase] ligase
VVVAAEQTSGIGRHGHSWDSRAGEGLYVSLVLRAHPLLTLTLGLAARAAILDVTALECDIRWPNDLMLSGKKFGGILVQVADEQYVAGIGVNIGQRSFPPELRQVATSLALETGLDFRRDDLLAALLTHIPVQMELTPAEVIAQWERHSSWACGKAVQVDRGDRTLTGITAGLDASGFLRVRKSNGEVELVIAGGVRPLDNQAL